MPLGRSFLNNAVMSKALSAWLPALILSLATPGCIRLTKALERQPAPPPAVGAAKPPPAPAKTIASKPAPSKPKRVEEPSPDHTGAQPVGEGKLALTLDCGPWADAEIASWILDLLEKRGIRATVFFSGKFVEKHPQVVAKAVAAGNQVGNHTYSHPDLTKLSPEVIVQEVEKTQSLIEKAAGHEVTPLYFRPPYGATNKKVEEAIRSLGFRSVMWTLEALDWQEGATVEKVVDRVLKKAKHRAIILMHITKITQEALPTILEKLKAQGYEFVPLGEALGPEQEAAKK